MSTILFLSRSEKAVLGWGVLQGYWKSKEEHVKLLWICVSLCKPAVSSVLLVRGDVRSLGDNEAVSHIIPAAIPCFPN